MNQELELQDQRQAELIDRDEDMPNTDSQNFEDLDQKAEMLIDSGMSVHRACKAVGIHSGSFQKRRNKREAVNEPRMINISYSDEAQKAGERVTIMIGDSKQIEHLLKLARGNND